MSFGLTAKTLRPSNDGLSFLLLMMTRETVRAFGVGGLMTAGIFFLVSYLEMGELDAALEAGAAEMIREADGEVVSVNQDNLHLHDQYYVL